ncbi:MAG: cytochrome biosis protein [Betaproteobacteria bacterium]|nr:cytochrome biosis protein [Betaproteobacteria bacterium]
MLSILLHVLAAAAYTALAAYFWNTRWMSARAGAAAQRAAALPARQPGFRGWERLLLTLAVLFHAWLLEGDMFAGGQFSFGFAHALSIMTLLALVFYGAESYVHPLEGLPVLVLPPAAICVMLPPLFAGGVFTTQLKSPAFAAHIAVSMLASAFFAIGAAHAVLMATMEKRLHGHARTTGPMGMPPLLTMERLLFQVLGVGFACLTLTVASGVFFSEEIFGRALQFDHKTVFSLLAWLIFGVLLLGRVAYGWRGRTALKGTFAGFAALLLAYVGSRFVLEVVLGRVAG